MTLSYLIEKEFIQIRHNPFIPKLILFFPIAIMLVFPWITSMEVKNIYITVVDNDHSTLSQRLVQRIQSSPYFKFSGMAQTNEEAMQAIERNDADVVLIIPHYYERDQVNGQQPQVLISANAVDGTKGGMGSAYLAQIVNQNLQDGQVKPMESPFSTVALFNPHKSYKLFMIPALMSLVVIMLCGFLLALNIVSEKEAGTIEQMNVTPVSKLQFILSKMIPYWVISAVVIIECIFLAWLVYGIFPAGSIVLIFLLSMLLALIFSGIGLIISNYSDAMQEAMFVMFFIIMFVMMLSGLFTPVASMPDWAQKLTLANPVTYFIEGMRTVFIRGGNLASIAQDLLILLLFAIVIDVWAVFSYKKIQ